MESNELKKILAGLCIAGLIAGSTFTLTNCTGKQSATKGGQAGAGSGASG